MPNEVEHAAKRLHPLFFFKSARELATGALLVAGLSARRHAFTAKTLQQLSSDAGCVHMMLMSMAMECLMKGKIALDLGADEPPTIGLEEWVKKTRTRIAKYGHDLLRLTKFSGVPVECEKEEQLLRDLTQVVQWRGRFPWPKQEKVDFPSMGLAQWEKLCEMVERASKALGADVDLGRLRAQLEEDIGGEPQ